MRLLGIVAAACVMAMAAASAVSADEVNLMASYGSADWQGDSLTFDSASGAVYFGGNGSELSAVLEIKAEGTGVYFRVDAGNGVNTSDSGYCTVEFCTEEGQVLSSVSTGSISGLENYSRFYMGSEDSYYPLPNGTDKLVVNLHAEGKSGKVNVYFRNFALFFSSEKPLGEPVASMGSIAGLSKVEVELDLWIRWVWIGLVFAVSLVFYFVKVVRDRYKTAEVMKAGKRKN